MSDELAIPSRTDNFDQFRQVLIGHGGPAFLRRAAQVNGAFDHLLDGCRRQRVELLKMVRLRLAMLLALAGSWDSLRSHIPEQNSFGGLKLLHAELNPQLRCPVPPSQSPKALARALADLIESIEAFNRRWLDYLRSIDLGAINKLRDDYNRYYVLEKECAVRLPSLARKGFHPLEPLIWEHILALLPALPVPRAQN